MTKQQFKNHWLAMYRVANRSDHESHEEWTHPEMSSFACCRLLDDMSRKMVECGVLTMEERQEWYDSL